jgi:hypothetical protein
MPVPFLLALCYSVEVIEQRNLRKQKGKAMSVDPFLIHQLAKQNVKEALRQAAQDRLGRQVEGAPQERKRIWWQMVVALVVRQIGA